MSTAKKKKSFRSKVEPEQCKGCERCVHACPKSVLKMEKTLNSMGYPYAVYIGHGCVGCGACFYNCPEPGAVTVFEVYDEDN